jgi:hypothetical protein
MPSRRALHDERAILVRILHEEKGEGIAPGVHAASVLAAASALG